MLDQAVRHAGAGEAACPITRGSWGSRCDGDMRRVSPQPLRPRGVVAGRQQQQEASEPLSRLWAPPYISPMTPSGHYHWRGLPQKPTPHGAGPVRAGCRGVPSLRLEHLTSVFPPRSHSGLWRHRSQLLGSGSQRSPQSRSPQTILSDAQKQPVPSLLEFEPSPACTRPWG